MEAPLLWYDEDLYLPEKFNSSVPQSLTHSTANRRDSLLLPAKRGGYKHSIDPFLIADFVTERKSIKIIADFCAGNGIVGVLLARKYPVLCVTGFEFQWNLAKEARKIILKNGLEERVNIACCDLNTSGKMISPGHFDVVVGNPPYRRAHDGRINPDSEKAIARHEIKITINGFLKASHHALRDRGRVFVIYHPYRLAELFEKLKSNRLAPLRVRFVHSFPGTEARMVMVEAVKNGKNDLMVEAPLFIYDEKKLYSKEVSTIYQSFGCGQPGGQM